MTGPQIDGPGEVAATIEVDFFPEDLAASDDAVWVTSLSDLHRIDPATNEVTDSIDLVDGAQAVDVTRNAVWVATVAEADGVRTGAVTRIDPTSLQTVANIEIGDGFDPVDLAATEQAIWVDAFLLTATQMARLDPAGEVEPRYIGFDGNTSGGVAATDDAVWATTDTGVVRIDPATNDVVATIEIDGLVTGVAATPTAVWAANSSATSVVRIDPDTNQIVATIDLGVRANAVAVSAGAVWVTNDDNGTVTRIDAVSNEIIDTIDAAPDANRLGAVAATRDATWVMAEDAIIRIDPGTT